MEIGLRPQVLIYTFIYVFIHQTFIERLLHLRHCVTRNKKMVRIQKVLIVRREVKNVNTQHERV